MHHSHVKTVRAMAKADWGQEHKTQEEAIKALIGKGCGIAEAALLEIVRRINQVVEALSEKPDHGASESQLMDRVKPSNIKEYPGVKVGDSLYACDELEKGVAKWTVIRVEGNHVRVISGEEEGSLYIHWGCSWMFATEAEALEQQAKEDVKYCEPRLALARRVLKAVKEGADLSEFRDGVDLDEEEEIED